MSSKFNSHQEKITNKISTASYEETNQHFHQQNQTEYQHEIDQERSNIENQIHHLIICTKLQNIFKILQKDFKYAFNIVKYLPRLKRVNPNKALDSLTKIIKSKTILQQAKCFSSIKDNYLKTNITNYQGFTMMQICLNKKVINYKTGFFENLRSLDSKEFKKQSQSKQQVSVEQKINDYLIQIVKVFMVITINNLQRYKQSLLNDALLSIKKYSSFKRIQRDKQVQQQKALKKTSSILKIETFHVKKQFRSKFTAFLKIKEKKTQTIKNHDPNKAKQVQNNEPFKNEQNPQLSIYVSSIKTMIVSLNNFEQKAESKTKVEKKKQSVFMLNNLLTLKQEQILKSSFYSLFDNVDFQMQKDKLQVLQRQIIALKEDMEDM